MATELTIRAKNVNTVAGWVDLANQSVNPIVIADFHGKIVYINEEFEKLSGYRLPEVIGKPTRILGYKDIPAPQDIWGAVWNSILSGVDWCGNITNRRRNGDLYSVNINVSAIDRNNVKLGFVAVYDDERSRRAREFDLEEKNRRLQTEHRIAKLGSWEWDCILSTIYCHGNGFVPNGWAGGWAIQDFLHELDPTTAAEFRRQLNACVSQKTPLSIDVPLSASTIHMDGIPEYDMNGNIVGIYGILQDITERKNIENQLVSQLTFTLALLDGSPNAIYYLNADGQYMGCNRRFEQLFNVNRSSIDIQQLLPYAVPLHKSAIDDKGVISCEVFDDRLNRDLFFSISPYGDSAGVIGTVVDITERKKSDNRIHYLAFHDNLTGLYNRLSFNQTVEQAVQTAEPFSILLLDLDHFKEVNDSLGHDIGDQLLVEVSRRLKSVTPTDDFVARLGGDEFAILTFGDPVVLADRIILLLRDSLLVSGNILFTEASIGLAVFPEDGDSTSALFKNADLALYKSKGEGRGRWNRFNSTMNDVLQQRLTLEALLRREINTFENFFLTFQPRIDLHGPMHVSSFECLLRLKINDQYISPAEFIPVAENSGLIIPISEWIIEKSFAQVREWMDNGYRLGISVNMSPHFFKTANLVPFVREMLERYRIPTDLIEFEITENILLEKTERVDEHVNALTRMGIRLSIDDFGTGYSSMNYLKKIRVHALKVDKSFIDDIGIDQDGETIVRTIIALGQSLGLTVVAEGVETIQQARFLISSGCDQIQGYFFAKPLPADRIIPYVRAGLDVEKISAIRSDKP